MQNLFRVTLNAKRLRKEEEISFSSQQQRGGGQGEKKKKRVEGKANPKEWVCWHHCFASHLEKSQERVFFQAKVSDGMVFDVTFDFTFAITCINHTLVVVREFDSCREVFRDVERIYNRSSDRIIIPDSAV